MEGLVAVIAAAVGAFLALGLFLVSIMKAWGTLGPERFSRKSEFKSNPGNP